MSISNLGGGPVGFLSKLERKNILSDKRIHRIDPHRILDDIIVVTNFKYSLLDRIKVKVFPNPKNNDLRVSEAGIFHNVTTVYNSRTRGSKYGGVLPIGTKEVLRKYACIYEQGNVSTHIPWEERTPQSITDVVCRVAAACKEISEISTPDWEEVSNERT